MQTITPDSNETHSLLEQVAAGRTDAMDALFERHRGALHEAVRRRLDRRVQPRVDPSDVVQETQAEAAARLPNYLQQRPMPFRLWLLKTAHERMKKIERYHLEATKREVQREVPLPADTSLQLAQGFIARGSGPAARRGRRDLVHKIRRMLGSLSEIDREIVMLRNFEALSNEEVACLLEIRPETAKKRYARALLRLQRMAIEQGLTEG